MVRYSLPIITRMVSLHDTSPSSMGSADVPRTLDVGQLCNLIQAANFTTDNFSFGTEVVVLAVPGCRSLAGFTGTRWAMSRNMWIVWPKPFNCSPGKDHEAPQEGQSALAKAVPGCRSLASSFGSGIALIEYCRADPKPPCASAPCLSTICPST